MIIDESESEIEFSTKRKEYCHAGIIGIDSNLGVTYGYDGGFHTKAWSREEKQELAKHMIGLWEVFGERG